MTDTNERFEMKMNREWLRAYAATRGFRYGAPSSMTPTPDGNAVLFLRSGARDPKQALFETSVATGETRQIVSADALLGAPETLSAAERARRERLRISARGFASFELSHDGALVLLPLSGRLFVLERATGKTRELKTGGAVLDPHFSPDGKWVAYVRGNDVYRTSTDGGGAESAITKGGTPTLTHGVAEFVAQEELGRSRGFWISPDGATVLYEQADISKVEVLKIVDQAHPENDPDTSAYPRAGKTNAEIRFGLTSAHGGATTWIEWDRKELPYVAKVTWSEKGPLTLTLLDRLQKRLVLVAVDPATGKTTPLLEERDEAWVNVDRSLPKWLRDGSGFLWSSERAGRWQLELRDAKGALVRALTKPELGYRRTVAVDGDKKTAIVEASDEPVEARIYAVPLDGGEATLVAGAPGEDVTATAGEKAQLLAVTTLQASAMPRFAARAWSGGEAREIPSAMEPPPGGLAKVELTTIGPDAMRVAIVRPRSFAPGKKYPIIDAAYGGPGVNKVTASAISYAHSQWLADATGAIVVSIDARGTPHRDRAWERAIYRKMGSVPIDGHVAAIEALGAKYPEMDTSRVGVHGWSFGGYFSALAVLMRPDVFKVAVAGAPVTDWRDYDTCYTERYMGLPDKEAAAYDASSALVLAAKPIPPGASEPQLLVVHGTADDNVYFLHSLKLADALVRAHRRFELLPLAGTTHMLVDPALNEAVWSRSAEFLRNGLR